MHLLESQEELPDIRESIAMEQGKNKEKKDASRGKGKPSGAGGIINLLHHMSRMFQDKLDANPSLERRVDRKLRRQIEEKKQAQGIKQ